MLRNVVITPIIFQKNIFNSYLSLLFWKHHLQLTALHGCSLCTASNLKAQSFFSTHLSVRVSYHMDGKIIVFMPNGWWTCDSQTHQAA
jgi:hypothetical protein